MHSSRLSSLSRFIFAFTALAGCAGKGDIDRTQPDKVDKSIFFDKTTGAAKTFYFRETVTSVPLTTKFTFEGMTSPGLEKVRFEITEKELRAYRAYDYVPGSQNDFTSTGNNIDTPVLKFAIKSHFDVKREYNPATGEQTNVISENTSDRPWDQRQFMRVDWSTNKSAGSELLLLLGGELPNGEGITPDAWSVSETDTRNPEYSDRPIISDGYIDISNRNTFKPDYYDCWISWGTNDDADLSLCGEFQIQTRYSLLEAKPSTYEPQEYPDNFPLMDDNGDPISLAPGGSACTGQVSKNSYGQYSGADCSTASVPGFSKFGFFRTVRQTYDRKYGATEIGRKYYANRWNIWKDTIVRDGQGNPVLEASGEPKRIPIEDREPKPIVYYTNIEFPDDPGLFAEAQAVTKDWSIALQKTVAGLKATKVDKFAPAANVDAMAAAVPEMVVLKRNSCNLADFTAFLGKYGDLENEVEDATGQSAKNLDKAHLAQACSVVEHATEKLPDGDAKKFTWQRVGDLRYSFFHWVDRPQPGGPLGYGPSSADPETGEIISASLFNYGAALDTYAQMSADIVELLNQQITVDDILSGKTIVDVMRETATTRKERDATQLTAEAKALASTLVSRGNTSRGPESAPRLVPVPTAAHDSKLAAIKGTPLEQLLKTPDIIAAMVPNFGVKDAPVQLTASQMDDLSSPVNWLSDKARAARGERFQKLATATNGCIYAADFADDAILGLALKLKGDGLSGDALFKNLRTLIFRGLADHEMGHTMGLRHNFAGSNDALNYIDDYWRVHETLPQTEWDKNMISEYAYSTVMDYGSRFNSDVHGLGKYDLAAIRFGYGQLIDVMPDGAQSGGVNLSNTVFLSDYTRLPAKVGGPDMLRDGGVTRYSNVSEPVRQFYLSPPSTQFPAGTFDGVNRERPYKFCSDEFVGNLDCKPWDFGANQKEIVSDTIDRYKNYYFFIAFKRGRLAWSLDGYLNRLLERYYARYTEAFQMYYFYGPYLDSLAADPNIGYDVDLGSDLLKASVDSFNALGEVLQTPEPGMHCPTTVSPDVMVLPDPTGPNACLSGQPFMNIQIPDGKPYFINLSDDYYLRITRAGSLYEKLGALISLTSTQARLFRVDTFADSNNFSINYYRLFKDEMLNLFGGVIRNDPVSYGGYVTAGRYLATPVVDLTTWGKVRPGTPPYMQPGTKRVDTPVNKTIRYYALLLGLANLNTTWDSTLDLGTYLAVTEKGAIDDVTYGASTVVHEFTHPQSGIVYRAPQFDQQRLGIGVELVDELNQIVGTGGVAGALPQKYGFLYRYPGYNLLPGQNQGDGYPNWQTAKANLAAALASGDQAQYTTAQQQFQYVDGLVAYRVDLLGDLRLFKQAFGY